MAPTTGNRHTTRAPVGSLFGYRLGCRCGPCRLAQVTACQRHRHPDKLKVRHELLPDGTLLRIPLYRVGPRWRCPCSRIVDNPRCPHCQTPAPWSNLLPVDRPPKTSHIVR